MIPKFRAWHKPNKIMLDVIAINFSLTQITADVETRKIYPELEYWWKETDIPFSEIELMQSTGLKDKNGVEIFEGDIVEVEKDFLNIIDYRVDDGCWRLKPLDGQWACSYFSNYYDKSSWEIIGNIYKNKELIK